MKFLIDECLSPKLVGAARDRGYLESTHVSWLGLEGSADWTLVQYALDGDWTFVTKNSVDFRGPAEAPGEGGLYAQVDVHAGLICLNGEDMDRAMQLDLFAAVLDNVEADGDLVNTCLEATVLEDDTIEVDRFDIPAEGVAPLWTE